MSATNTLGAMTVAAQTLRNAAKIAYPENPVGTMILATMMACRDAGMPDATLLDVLKDLQQRNPKA